MNNLIDLDEEEVVVLPTSNLKGADVSSIQETLARDESTEDVAHEAQGRQTRLATLEEVEREHIMGILEYTQGNKSEAAKILGITIKSVYNKLHMYEAQGHKLGVAGIRPTVKGAKDEQ